MRLSHSSPVMAWLLSCDDLSRFCSEEKSLERKDNDFRTRNFVYWLQPGGGKAGLYAVKRASRHKPSEEV